MTKSNKINLSIFVILVLLPHLIRVYFNDSLSGILMDRIQYVSLVMSAVGGLLIIFFSSYYYKKTRGVSSKSLIAFIVLGSIVTLLSIFLILLLYSLRKGVGF